jgi:hypothetical protein
MIKENAMTEDEIREAMTQFKVDNPDVDWDKYEVYAVQEAETGKLERIGYAERHRIMQIGGTPEVGR